jgi:hypothetical protein
MAKDADALVAALRAHGMTYPGAHVKSPWPEHLDLAVKDKTFAFLSAAGQPFHVTGRSTSGLSRSVEP